VNGDCRCTGCPVARNPWQKVDRRQALFSVRQVAGVAGGKWAGGRRSTKVGLRVGASWYRDKIMM
jgi:hypothetical protein